MTVEFKVRASILAAVIEEGEVSRSRRQGAGTRVAGRLTQGKTSYVVESSHIRSEQESVQ